MNNAATIDTRLVAGNRSVPQPSSIFVIGSLLLMMVVAGSISLFFQSGESVRLDEAQSLWQSTRTAPAILTIIAEDVHVPLYHELLHFWRLGSVTLGFGDGVPQARALSLLFFLLTIPALYLLGSAAFSKRVGLLAALLLAVSPFVHWYGSEIRMYTLFLLLTTLNHYFFVRLFTRAAHEQRRVPLWLWVGYALTAIFGVYSHYFFFLNFAGQAVFYFLNRKHWSSERFVLLKFAGIILLVVLLFAPWVWYVFDVGKAINQQPLLSRPTAINLFNAFSQFFFGFQEDATNTIILSLWPLAVPLAFLTLKARARFSPLTQYLMISVLLSFALVFAVSFIRPVFVSRYLIFTLTPILLLTAVFCARFMPRTAIAGAIVLTAAMLAVQILNPSTPVKENYREAAAYLTSHAKPQDIVVLSAPFTLYPIEYYYRGVAPLATLPIWDRYESGPIPPFIPENFENEVRTLAGPHQEMWVLLSYDQGYEETVREYLDTHYQRTSMKVFSHDLTLYSYRLRYDTPILTARAE